MLQEQSALKADKAGRFAAKSVAPSSAGLWSRHEGFRAKTYMGLDLQRPPHLEDSGLRPSVVTDSKEGLGEHDLGMAKEKCFTTMQKNGQWVFPCSKIHAISDIWKDLRTMRYTQLHPLHQWDTREMSNAANNRTLPLFHPAPCCFPAPSPCTLASFSFHQAPVTLCN